MHTELAEWSARFNLNLNPFVNMPKNSTPAPDALSYLTGEGCGLDFPPAISAPGGGGKFDFSGEVLAHPGNTFICHIDPQSIFYQSLSNLQDAIRTLPQAHCLTLLPKPSFHMTIFCGMSGDPLGVDGWPEDIQRGASLDSISSQWIERLNCTGNLGGFSVRPSHMRAPYSISMQPASDQDAAALLDARTRLERLTGLVRGDAQSYQFHVTLGYLVKWIKFDEAQQLVESANRLFDKHLSGSVPVKLGHVEFCTFETMHRFTPVIKAESKFSG